MIKVYDKRFCFFFEYLDAIGSMLDSAPCGSEMVIGMDHGVPGGDRSV